MRNWNSPQKLEWEPKWFRVQMFSRKIIDGVQEKEVGFTSGTDLKSVRAQMKESVGIGWYVKVKEVEYDQITKELDR